MGKLTIQTKTIPTHAARLQVATTLANDHYARVIADGGTIDSYSLLVEAVQELINIYLSGNLALFIAAAIDPAIFGYKYRTDATGTWCVKAYSLMGASSDVVQATPAAQPLLLRYSGEKYGYFPGIVSNNISTPNAAANQIIGDITVISKVRFIDAADEQTIVSKYQNSNASWSFRRQITNELAFFGTFDGINIAFSENTVETIAAGADVYVKVFRDATTGAITFSRSSDGTVWTPLTSASGAQPSGNMFNSTTVVRVGERGNNNDPFLGRIYSVDIYNEDSDNPGATPVVTFNAEDYDIAVSQNTLTSSATSEVWTRNRSAALTGNKVTINYRTSIMNDGVDNELIAPVFAQAQPNTVYSVFDEMTWEASDVIVDGGTAVPYSQTTATPNLSANAGVALDFVGETANRLKHYMIQFAGISSITGVNGSEQAPADAGVGDIDELGLGANAGANFANCIINTVVVAKQADNLSTRNAMNVLVRAWNGNPLV